MLEQVEQKINELKKQQKEEYYKKKDADLISWGLVDNKNSKGIPLIVTDEEYEALIDASNGVGMTSRNHMVNILNVAALAIIVLGIIIGFVLMQFHDEMGFIYLSASVFIAIILSLVFRGLSEAIRLLQQILDMKTTDNKKKVNNYIKQAPEYPEKQPQMPREFTAHSFNQNNK